MNRISFSEISLILILSAMIFYFVVAHLYGRFMRHQEKTGLEALRYLTLGPKTLEEIAKHLGIPTLEAQILLNNYEHKYLVESRFSTPWDFNGDRQEVKPIFRITAIGNKVLEQNPDKKS